MSDGLKASVDFSELNRRIDAWAIEAGKDAPEALRTQARLFTIQCAKLTPPRRDNKSPKPTNASQAEGARKEAFQRIDRALRKVFSVAGSDYVEHVAKVYGTSGLNVWMTNKDDVRVNLQWKKILFNQDQLKVFHLANTKGGRPRKTWRIWKGTKTHGTRWQADAVVGKSDLVKYADHVKGNMGRMLASWAVPYYALGGQGKNDWKIPQWVSKHVSGARGIANTANLRGLCPSVTLGSNARGIGLVKFLVPFAIKIRMAAMKTDMKLYAKGIKRRFEK